MSNSTVSMYKFKPFQFKVLEKNDNLFECPLGLGGTRVTCNDTNLFCSNFVPRLIYPPIYDSNGYQVLSNTQIWKYSFDFGKWQIIAYKDIPLEFAFSSVMLSGNNIIIIYGGSRIHFEDCGSNRIYWGNLANEFKENEMKFEELQVSGDIPMALNGRSVVMNDNYIYAVGGKSLHRRQMDVHRLDLNTRKWEKLYNSHEETKVSIYNYLLEVFFYKDKIYIFDSRLGGAINVFSEFAKIKVFDVATKQWTYLQTNYDHKVPVIGYPSDRGCHSCYQCPEKSNLLYISGGLNGFQCLTDIWRFDLDKLQWKKLTWCTMPQPIYSHSTTVTHSGRICCYGGMVTNENVDRSFTQPSTDITSAWITIPKLKVICWEAMLHYFKKQMFESSEDHLKKMGLPQEFCERVIKARRPVLSVPKGYIYHENLNKES